MPVGVAPLENVGDAKTRKAHAGEDFRVFFLGRARFVGGPQSGFARASGCASAEAVDVHAQRAHGEALVCHAEVAAGAPRKVERQ